MEQKNCSNICGKGFQEMSCGNDISCYAKIAGTLTGEEIKEHNLVIPEANSPESCYQPTTYDLTLGEGHYIYNGNDPDKDEKWKLVFIGTDTRLNELNNINPEAEKYKRLNKDKPQTLFIPPFGSAFIQLNETVDTYTVAKERRLLIVGRFDLKLSNVHQGLISQQATQVEPCYKGKLFCFVHNLSNQEIQLKYGQKIATIEFSYVSCFCNKQKREQIIEELIAKNKSGKYKKPFCTDTGISEVRYFHADEQLPGDCGLLSLRERMIDTIKSDEVVSDLAKKVEKNVDKKSKWIPLLATTLSIIGTIILACIALPQKEDISSIQEIDDEQNRKIDELENKINRMLGESGEEDVNSEEE